MSEPQWIQNYRPIWWRTYKRTSSFLHIVTPRKNAHPVLLPVSILHDHEFILCLVSFAPKRNGWLTDWLTDYLQRPAGLSKHLFFLLLRCHTLAVLTGFSFALTSFIFLRHIKICISSLYELWVSAIWFLQELFCS